MKIYLFNPETGVYLGEDFADDALMKQRGYVLPPGATTLAPRWLCALSAAARSFASTSTPARC